MLDNSSMCVDLSSSCGLIEGRAETRDALLPVVVVERGQLEQALSHLGGLE